MKQERVIDVREQKKLSLKKCFHLVLSGIHHRLLRSGLTMSVILLAVAFFMAMLSENMYLNSISNGVEAEIFAHREASFFLSFISSKPSSLVLSKRLAEIRSNPEEIAEYAAVAGVEADWLYSLADKCRWEQTYYRFFSGMRRGHRSALIGKKTGMDIFRYLSDPIEMGNFASKLEPLRSLKLPGDIDTFRSFCGGLDEFTAGMAKLEKSWREAIDRFAVKSDAITGGTRLDEWLISADGDALKKWQALVAESGFLLPPDKFARIQDLLRKSRARNEVILAINSPKMKKAWKETFKESTSLDNKLMRLDEAEVRALFAENFPEKSFSPEQLKMVSTLFMKERRLNGLEKSLESRTEKQSGGVLSGRQLFLMIISFVVCMVGIANAMLMAITERFREIATMKCLGATDGYILTQFMMEAGIQGLAGGLLGMLIGFALSVIKSGAIFGVYLFKYFPLAYVATSGVGSVLAGVLLAALASLYPSWAASRMAPMEAMRIE